MRNTITRFKRTPVVIATASISVRSIIVITVAAALLGWFGLAPVALAQSDWDLYTVSNDNMLMKIDLSSNPYPFAATPIGKTQDTVGGTVRRIRGLAYDAGGNIRTG
jgi:hypothetical protein